MYSLSVERDPEQVYGPGRLYLHKDGEIVSEFAEGWPVITGGNKLDPNQYGGITPPNIEFTLLSEIKYQKHPRGYSMTMCIIYPESDEDRKEFFNRTFAYDPGAVPFMIHVAGRSTGCIAIRKSGWEQAKSEINKAFHANQQEGVPLTVVVYDL